MTTIHRHRLARRGFTLLELALAALVGGMIVMACFGVFRAMDSADRVLKNRFDQSAQLARLQTIMRRTFVNLAMSPRTEPRPARQNSPPSSTAPTTAGAAESGRDARRNVQTEPTPGTDTAGSSPPVATTVRNDQPPEPPRIILAEDRRISDTPMMRLPITGAEDRGISAPASWKPQRLEVVLARPPVPLPRMTADGRGISPFPEAESGREEFTEEEVAGTKLFRGIFELQPVPAGDRGPGGSPARSILTWALYWRPMPPGALLESGESGRVDEFDLAPPSLIASDLTYLRWQFYDDRIKKTEFATAYVRMLPAYVEMEVQTASGIWNSWMFEVDFVMSTEESPNSEGNSTTAREIKAPTRSSAPRTEGDANR